MKKISIISFYNFVKIEDRESLQAKLLLICKKKNIKGTIYLATEGFNGSLCGDQANVFFILNELTRLTGAVDVNIKENFVDFMPFDRMKVRLKKEIIAIKVENLDLSKRGEYIEPSDWDDFIERDDVVLVDTRNDYEVKYGTFENAINPNIETFRDFPRWTSENLMNLKDKKIAMFCTGGIRCEKSTALLKQLGFDEVYHLKGGILQYLQDTNNLNQKWKGECFVFDDRVLVNSSLEAVTTINSIA